MDLWTFKRYHSPQLDVDFVNVDSDNGAIVIQKDVHAYTLQTDDVDAAEFIASEISSLTSADAGQWQLLRDSEPDSNWGMIGQFLDQRSLISESADQADAVRDRLSRHLTQIVTDTSAAVRQKLEGRDIGMFQETVRIVKSAIEADTDFVSLKTGAHFFSAAVEPNFFCALLQCELEYFRRKSPLTLSAVYFLMTLLDDSQSLEAGEFAWCEEEMIIYDHSDLEAHLWLVAQCLIESAGPDAARLPLDFEWPSDRCCGLEFMRRIELATRAVGKQWGENPYVTALDALGNDYSPLVAGPFIEQYHVTRRFVEILAPTLSKRLIPPLRKMIFQYYGEEVGHEALESTTCEILGASQADLDKLIPLPGHFAFVDILTLVAILDPIASFASIMVIEGVFGEPPKMSLRLAAIARTNPAFASITDEHEEMNEDLNHNSISRNAFESIESIPVETQLRVMHSIMFLLELNHRAWGWIVDYYGPQKELMLHGPLGTSFAPKQNEDVQAQSHRDDLRKDIRLPEMA